MPSATEIVLEYICPSLGAILSNVMFSAPFKDVRKAVARGTLGDLNPTPWAFMLGNCTGWVTYSYLIQNQFVFWANAPGLILAVWLNMSAAKLQYNDYCSNELRQSFVRFLDDNRQSLADGADNVNAADDRRIEHDETAPRLQRITNLGRMALQVSIQEIEAPAPHEKVVVCLVLAWITVISLVCFVPMSQDDRELVVGIVVNANLLFFYGAPLSTIFTVLRTRSSASIHIWTMLTNTANGSFWAAYGISVRDYYILIPNGLGAVLGVIQMFLVMTFPRKSSADDLRDGGPQELESGDAECAIQQESTSTASENSTEHKGERLLVECAPSTREET